MVVPEHFQGIGLFLVGLKRWEVGIVMRVSFREDWLWDVPVVGILRGVTRRVMEGLVPAVMRGGLRQLEITMNTPGAVELIRHTAELAEGRMNIGAGTVLSE